PRPQAAARPPVRERRHGGPALAAGGRAPKHDGLAAAHQEAQSDRVRRHYHVGGLRPAEGVFAAEPGLAAPLVGRGVGPCGCRSLAKWRVIVCAGKTWEWLW